MGALRRHALILIAALAAAHALAYLPFETHITGDSQDYLAAAHALRHGDYSTPLAAAAAPATGFSSHPGAVVDITDHVLSPALRGSPERQVWRAPTYPALVAAVGGGGPGLSRDLLFLVQALLVGLSTWLAGDVARRLWGMRVGLVAAGLFALDPFSKRYAGLVLSEALATALAMAAVYAYVRAQKAEGLRWWATAGLAGGLLALTRPGLAPIVAIVAVAAAATSSPLALRAARSAAVLAACALVLVPWLAWTGHTTGSPTMQAYGSGVNLLVAARGQGPRRTIFAVASGRPFMRDVLDSTRSFPSDEQLSSDPSAHARYLVRVDHALRSRAFAVYRHELATQPGTVVGDYTWRAQTLWMAHRDWYQPSGGALLFALRLADWLVMLVIGTGVVLAVRRGPPALVLGAMLVVTTLLLALGEAEARFTIPLRPLAFCFAGLAVVEAYGALSRLLVTARTRTRPATTD